MRRSGTAACACASVMACASAMASTCVSAAMVGNRIVVHTCDHYRDQAAAHDVGGVDRSRVAAAVRAAAVVADTAAAAVAADCAHTIDDGAARSHANTYAPSRALHRAVCASCERYPVVEP